MSKKVVGGGGGVLQKDAPWRAAPSAAIKPLPKIHYTPVVTISENPYSNYALSLVKHPDPIGDGLGTEAIVEAAGPDCIVPGQVTPVKLLGLKVWPIDIDLKFMEPVGKELKNIGKPIYHRYKCVDGTDILIWVQKGYLIEPIDIDLKFMEPVGKELKNIGKFMDSAVELMNKSFDDR